MSSKLSQAQQKQIIAENALVAQVRLLCTHIDDERHRMAWEAFYGALAELIETSKRIGRAIEERVSI